MSAARSFRVAVVGATGLVGAEIVSLLEERGFPISELSLYASERSRGESLEWNGESIEVQPMERPLPEVDIAFLCATAEVSAEVREELAAGGALVIDLATANAQAGAIALTATDARVALQASGAVIRIPDPLARVIAVPLLALRGIAAPLRVVSTLIVSASRFGKGAVERLSRETIRLLSLQDSESETEPTEAFRCTPLETREGSAHLEEEIHELIGEDLPLSIRMIRVPMFHGHAASLAIQFAAPIDVAAVRARLRETPSLLVAEENGAPVSTLDALAIDAMHVTEIASSPDDPTWLSLWVLGDNVRQGAALAAVSLVEGILLRH